VACAVDVPRAGCDACPYTEVLLTPLNRWRLNTKLALPEGD
jgi:hypothetical protein